MDGLMFRSNDTVRLDVPHGDVRAGTLGRVVDYFARETDPAYVVSFEDTHVVCDDVRAGELAAADDEHPAA